MSVGHGTSSSCSLMQRRARLNMTELFMIAIILLFGYFFIFHNVSRPNEEWFTNLGKYAKDNPESICSALRFDDIKSLDPYTEQVIDYVRCNHLFAPSKEEYVLTETEPSRLKKEIEQIFGNKTNGFFIECGAHDGQFLSNTLELEMRLNWTGLLVEADPVLQTKLLGKHRKSWVANVCASPTSAVSEIDFLQSKVTDEKNWLSAIGRLNDPAVVDKLGELESIGTVRCFPLPTLLAALGVKHVDLLSLDVEGVDLNVLKTFPPYEQLSIDVVIAEYSHVPEGKDAVRSFMESRGYRTIGETMDDFVFQYAGY